MQQAEKNTSKFSSETILDLNFCRFSLKFQKFPEKFHLFGIFFSKTLLTPFSENGATFIVVVAAEILTFTTSFLKKKFLKNNFLPLAFNLSQTIAN